MSWQWRLATFNIESLDCKPTQASKFEKRIDALRPLLLRMNADVLCLQEVNAQRVPNHKERSFAALEKLLRGTAYGHYHLVTSHDPGTGNPADVHNLAVLSRWPIIGSGQIYHDFVPPLTSALSGEGLKWDRPVQRVEIAIPDGRRLHVLNLHLRAPRAVPLPVTHHKRLAPVASAEWAKGFYLAAAKRQGQALEARLAVEELFNADPAALVAVCGDLNSDIYETPAKILCASATDRDNAQATEAVASRSLVALDSRVSEAARFSVLHDGRPVMLDHILVSEGLAHACSAVEIFNAGLQDEFLSPELVSSSFHAPVIATFSPD
ncbi:MAG: endonuclease/exonuclease/phosphatase family protein [Hyphomicrobiales bacterium]|nr:endonuclease/exonuclease/phosphatase family protein [Hyphomicrobiales bacterium]